MTSEIKEIKFEDRDIGKGFYCEMQKLGLPTCPCIKRSSCVGCGNHRRVFNMTIIYCMTHDVGIKKVGENWKKFALHDHKPPCCLREFKTKYPKDYEVNIL